MGFGPGNKLGFYQLNELGPGQLGLCGPRWTRSDQGGPGAPGPLSHRGRLGFETQLTFHKTTKFPSHIFSLFSQPLQPPQPPSEPPLPPGVAAAAPPSLSHNHRAGKSDLQEVGSGFMLFGVSLHDNGLDCQCGLILGVFAYDHCF